MRLVANVTCNNISVTYVRVHRCAGGLKKLDLRSGSQRNRYFVGFFHVSVQAPTRGLFFTVIPRNRPISVAFYDAHGDTEDLICYDKTFHKKGITIKTVDYIIICLKCLGRTHVRPRKCITKLFEGSSNKLTLIIYEGCSEIIETPAVNKLFKKVANLIFGRYVAKHIYLWNSSY